MSPVVSWRRWKKQSLVPRLGSATFGEENMKLNSYPKISGAGAKILLQKLITNVYYEVKIFAILQIRPQKMNKKAWVQLFMVRDGQGFSRWDPRLRSIKETVNKLASLEN